MFKRYGWDVWLALGFISLGFIMIGVAWNGAASQNCIQCQFPYILSGGVGGLGLIILGASLLLFIAGRRMLHRLESKYDAMLQAIGAGALAGAEHAATNGKAAAPAPAEEGMVIVGRSSFHLPDCRLVEGKEDMEAVQQDEAVTRGLNACRVCDPLAPRTQARRTKAGSRRR